MTIDPREYLKRKIRDVISQAREIINSTHKIEGDANKLLDQAKLVERAIPLLPDTQLERQAHLWDTTKAQLDRTREGLFRVQPVISTISSTSSTDSGDFTELTFFNFNRSNALQLKQVEELITDFKNFQDVDAQYSEALLLLASLNLDEGSEKEIRPSAQIEIAYQAYKLPVTEIAVPVSTSAIPLREAINTLINRLRMKKPIQEPTKNEREKVASILSQLMRDELTRDLIDIQANQWYELNDKLSSTKTENINRETWRRILFQGLSFIKSFLSSVDIEKFKQ